MRRRLRTELKGLGSGIGFSASPDFFSYSMKLKRDVLTEGFAIFTEVLGHPTFPAEEVEREKQAIYAEIRRQQDNNIALAMDQFSAACYGDSPYGLPSSGIAEAVAEQTPATLAAWREGLMTAENMAIGIVGDLSEEEAIALFDGLLPARAGRISRRLSRSISRFGKGFCRVTNSSPPPLLGFPGANIYDEDRYALDMLAEIVSGMGGRFFRAVRGDNALAYQVSGFHRSRQDAGNFAAYASTAPENEERARDLLLAQCALLTREPVTAQELASGKASMIGEHAIGTQTFGAQAGELAVCGVYGLGPDEPARYLQRISSLTAEDMQAIAAKYLTPDRYWLGAARGGAE